MSDDEMSSMSSSEAGNVEEPKSYSNNNLSTNRISNSPNNAEMPEPNVDKPKILNLVESDEEENMNQNETKTVDLIPTKQMEVEMESDQNMEDSVQPTKKRTRRRRRAKTNKEEEDDEDTANEAPPLKKQKTSTKAAKASKSKKKNDKKSGTKLKGTEATEKVREFMLFVNRPHTKNSAKAEMKAEMTVGQIQKSMDELAEKEILSMREFGKKSKTKIYWANQQKFEEENDGNTAEEEADRLRQFEAELIEKKAILSGLKKKIAAITKEPTDAELRRMHNELQAMGKEIDSKLKKVEGNNAEKVAQADIDEKKIEFNKYAKAWKERKQIVNDMVSRIFQGSGLSNEEALTKKVGGETDKENDVNWDNYKDLYKETCTFVQKKKDEQKKKKKPVKKK